jgi:flagella basal body P-ring formation protein FlgA
MIVMSQSRMTILFAAGTILFSVGQDATAQVTKAYYAAEPKPVVAATISVYPRLTYQARTTVRHGGLIHLGDLAKVYTRDAGLKQQLEDIDLDQLDSSVDDQVITRVQIQTRIALAGMPMRGISFVGSQTVRLASEAQPESVTEKRVDRKREGFPKDSDALGIAIAREIQVKAADQFDVALQDVIVTPQSSPVFSEKMPSTLLQVAGDQGFGEFVEGSGGRPALRSIKIISDGGAWIGNRTIEFIELDGGKLRRGKIMVSIIVQKEVLFATRALSRGEELSTGNTRLSEELFTSSTIEQAVGESGRGRFSARSIRQGDRIKTTDVGSDLQSRQVMVKAGDLVTVDLQRNGLNLSMSECIARQSGRIGDFIKVESSINNKVLIAKVVSPVRLLIR